MTRTLTQPPTPGKKVAAGILITAALLAFGISFSGTLASEELQTQPTPEPVSSVPMSDEECLACHRTPDMFLPLPSGEELHLTIDEVRYNVSVHGRNDYACVQCHTEITGYPHPEFEAETARQFTVQMAEKCGICHTKEYDLYRQGDHAKVLEEGDLNAAVCTDCHGAHDIQGFGISGVEIARTCQRCHAEIYGIYKDSVHGQALIEESNLDVPTCVDCHSNHSNAGPIQQPEFHLFSPQICAKCHADEELMSRYGVNTNVFETYVSDFHGTTVLIFEKIAPHQQTNKPVCVDCHSVHDIRSPEDMESTVMKHNLLDTCARCHPEATPDFPDAWLSHYPPDIDHNPLVFMVDLFYKLLIPGTVGGMMIFIATDVWRRWFGKDKQSKENNSA